MSEQIPSEQRVARIRVTAAQPGYAHTKFEGTCDADVTIADIRKWLNTGCGYRNEWISDGKWGGVRHDD